MKVENFLRLNRLSTLFQPTKKSPPPHSWKDAALVGPNHIYDQDGLRTGHNHEFMDDQSFRAAYH